MNGDSSGAALPPLRTQRWGPHLQNRSSFRNRNVRVRVWLTAGLAWPGFQSPRTYAHITSYASSISWVYSNSSRVCNMVVDF